MEEYPREVQGHPLLLASLVGATSLHPQLTEALHDAAVNACKQRRFKYLSSSYDMRILPAKRGGRDSPNYRWEGVLKRSWLEKMCGSIPAVLVLCIDWSQELSQAEQEESQALHYLQHARRQAKERDLRLVLFVVLHPKTADPEAATRSLHEGAGGLVMAMGLEDLKAKAPSLERLIYQNAISFYADEESELMDFLERMDLCNHIALRMYQRYFSYHDVGAAVHHCRIHVNSLKKYCSENSEYVWRKWHWLSLNHQIFGDLLDTIMQRVPLLIDISDIWQFPGFHFQAAAVYARRLREWAVRCMEPGHLPPAPTAGGAVLPSAFLGQAGHLERPTEVTSPKEVVALRLAWEQAQKHKEHAERSLKLLIRAQAAAKERNLSSWIITSQIRVAEAYLCDQSSSHQEAARDLFERLRKQPNSSWAPFQRFFLERALLCGCSQLGLPIPSLCSSTRAVPAVLESLEAMPSDELRSNLVRDAFEYLGLKAAPAWNDRRQGEELLALIKHAAEPLPARSIEIALPRGRLTSELLDASLTFATSGLAVPLALSTAVALGAGDLEMTLEMGEQTWEVGQPFTVKSVPTSGCAPVRLRFTWALADAVVFVGESGESATLLGELKLPGTHEVGLPERILCPWGPLGPQWNFRGKLNSELLFPVDPSKALVSDTFLFFLALSGAPVAPAASELRLTANVQVEEGDPATVLPAHPLESSKSPRVSLISAECELIPIGDEKLLAEVAQEVQPLAGVLSFQPGDLQRPGAKDVGYAWPIAVQCGRACKMTVNFALTLGHAVSRTSATITFQHAMRLQIAEERMATSLTLQRPVSFALKSLHGPVETSTVEVLLEDGCQKCLGRPGLMAIGSAHAFIWPQPANISRAVGRPRLRVEFQKHKAVGEFFQWLPSAKRPAQLPGGGVAEWLLPLDLPTPLPSMQVELEVGSIGTVGTPLKVEVRLKNATFSEEEIRVRVLQEGDVSDRYLFSGPVSSQASPLSLAPDVSPESPVLQPFCLIPLKPGWVSLPKVQVLWAHQEATSSSSSVFVAPRGAPAVHRTTA